jgi:hypothetical protein
MKVLFENRCRLPMKFRIRHRIFKPVSKINLPPQQNPAKPRDDLPLDWSSSTTFFTSGTPSLYILCKNLHYEEENCILSS